MVVEASKVVSHLTSLLRNATSGWQRSYQY